MSWRTIKGNCFEWLPKIVSEVENPIIVTDPPFNVGYHYATYKDNMPKDEYYSSLLSIFKLCPHVVIHYEEALFELAVRGDGVPNKVVSWVYNSNTPKQHRGIGFWGVQPEFTQVKQPYKNLNDKRILERIANGFDGCKLYDWWEINQVKNVSKDKTIHPCQMPQQVLDNIVGLLPKGSTIIEPFMGSATTGIACLKLGYDFVGVEMDDAYYDLSVKRLKGFEDELNGVGTLFEGML